MALPKYVLGFMLIITCTSVSAKTFNQYLEEARKKSPACHRYDVALDKAVKANSQPSLNDVVSAGIVGEDIRPNAKVTLEPGGNLMSRENQELEKLQLKCDAEARSFLTPEALLIGKAEYKARFEHDLKAGYINPDGSRKQPPWYKTIYRESKRMTYSFFETLGSLLILPIGFITLMLGLLLVFKPATFAELMRVVIGGIINFIFRRSSKKKESSPVSK